MGLPNVWYPMWTGTELDVSFDARTRPGRLRIGLLSAGRAGSVIAAVWRRAGHDVIGVGAISQASRDRAATLLSGVPIREPQDIASDCELLLLAVPDDVLPTLVAGLVDVGAIRPGIFVVHLSGRHGLAVLEPATRIGAVPLALHPAMTLTGTASDLERLDGCPWAVSSPEAMRPVAEALVVEAGGEPSWIPDDARVKYHAALTHAANHLVTLTAQAQELLAGVGVQAPGRFLAPLLSAGLDNALRYGDDALTGPISRGDAGTIQAHLAALADVEPELRASYQALARATMVRAEHRGALDRDAQAALADLLPPMAPLTDPRTESGGASS